MFRYFKALWYMITGRFAAAGEALQANKHVMSATYDASIKKGAERFNTVKNAVAELMAIEQTRLQEIKDLTVKAETKQKIQAGAKVAMQRRINTLRKEGKNKEECQMDAEFIKHSSAYKDASSTLSEVEARIDEKEVDLKERQTQVSKFKAELQGMQRAQRALKEEKSEAVADVAVAQQMEAVNSVLAGISEDSTDKDLMAAREARKKAKARASITAELTGNDAVIAENEYLAEAAGSVADSELDDLLDWGDNDDDKDNSLADAKLTE